MSTRSFRASFILDMTGNLRRQARRFGDSFRRMGRDGERELGRIGRAAAAVDRRLNRSLVRGGAVAGAALVAGTALAIRRIGTLEVRLERLGIEAGKTRAEMSGLRDDINDIAKDPKIRIDPSELLSAFEMIQEKTGDLGFADAVKREMAIAIQATGQSGQVIGDLIASLYHNFGFRTRGEIAAGLDVLALQGRQGQFTIPHLATQGPRVLAAYSAFDQGGVQGLANAGAMLQIVRQSTGGPEQAATAFEAILRTFIDSEKFKKIAQLGRDYGFDVRTKDGKLREPTALLRDLVRTSGGDPLKLAKLFDSEAMRGVLPLAQEFRRTGGFSRLDQLAAIRGDGAFLAGASARLGQTTNASARGLATNINDAIEDHAMEPIRKLTDSLNALLDSGIKLTADDALNIALAGVGTLAAAKGGLWALRGGTRVRGKGGRGGASGLPVGALDAVPVIVTNWPGSMRDRGRGTRRGGGRGAGAAGAAGAGAAGAAAASRRGLFGRAASFGGKAALRAIPLAGWGLLGTDLGAGFASLSPTGSRYTGDRGAVDRALRRVGGFSHPLPPGVPIPGSASVNGVQPFAGDGPTRDDIRAYLDAQTDTTDETRVSADKIVAELRAVRADLLRAQRMPAMGPGPATGRVMVGPQ